MSKKVENIIIIVFAAMLFGGGFWVGYSVKKCPGVISSTVVIHDSIAPAKDTIVITLISGKPTKVKHAKYNDTIKQESKIDTSISIMESTAPDCRDTNYYEALKFYPDSFRARATGVVSGNELITWNVDFQNLQPEVIKIVERTNTVEKKQSLVKVYAGLYAGVALKGQTIGNYRGGVAFDAIISDRHMIGLNGGVNSFMEPEIGLQFSEKIRFKK